MELLKESIFTISKHSFSLISIATPPPPSAALSRLRILYPGMSINFVKCNFVSVKQRISNLNSKI
jgi:hypothetical protein